MTIKAKRFLLSFCFFLSFPVFSEPGIVVFQSDFGIADGAVSEVKGVMYSVDRSLIISDLTNEIPPYNIWDAAYRLYQTASYWPKKTVFVSVVDPGVGTTRRSVVALSKQGQYFVTPDNGTLTFIDTMYGIEEVRIINETENRLKGSQQSYTFYGRDVYGYTAAKLASGKISFAEVGPVLKEPVVKLAYQKARVQEQAVQGTVVILDPNYGNVWTDINQSLLKSLKENKTYKVSIFYQGEEKYAKTLTLYKTFGETKQGEDLLYFNSLMNLSLATNQDSFAKKYHIGSGADWTIRVEPSN
ncbi:S-adenosyl-l-methionine hydroxide adenosyltransferase family protein [Legionella sp. km772]|uniref:SAM hydrolase/SAM-dependent halogenase family protein n=1 Tax=Legionella sp. km772 TaxID=2498111 RepID=UPI000F8D8C6B|nr:S-adenosyl-l-methionine hydroxide adenosyltransferase family protein [Legionella sp. km772]RUR07336.1 DNA-directed RNA polymerase subunit delta [Legionella sp. km772]